MIDYLTVIYKNYDLLDLQLDNFKKRFSNEDYRLIIVDNTPDSEKKKIQRSDEIDIIIELESFANTFDGVSHGGALDVGLQHCESDIVCLFDSDFFFLNSNLNTYVKEKFADGYVAVGVEWDDGCDTRPWVEKFPDKFNNIPCPFGAFYDLKFAKSESWIITHSESQNPNNRSEGFIEAGWRIRRKILNEKIKTLGWKTSPISDNESFSGYGNCFFMNECGIMMGVHYGAGSHRRWSENSYKEIEKLLEGDFNV